MLIARSSPPRTLTPPQLCLILWKNNFFIPIQNENSKLTGAILRLIERQRDGQKIDEELLKRVVGSFVSLGLDEADINGVSLDVYKEHFEIPFLEATEKYYELRSETFLAGNSIPDYLRRAEEWLKEEEDRVERYLNTSTKEPLIGECVRALFREHPKLMDEESQSLFDYDDDDLQRMHALITRAPEGLEPLRNKLEEHMRKAGLPLA